MWPRIFRRHSQGRVYGVLATKRGLGATHIALSIASYLGNIAGESVLYYERKVPSSIGQCFVDSSYSDDKIGGAYAHHEGKITYIYDSVISSKDIMKYKCKDVVIDFGANLDEVGSYLKLCDKLIIITSVSPWCKRQHDYFMDCLISNYHYDMTQMEILAQESSSKAKSLFIKRGYYVKDKPFIADPFRLRRTEYKCIYKLIKV